MTPTEPEPWITVVEAASERETAELALVLTARGIDHRRVRVPGGSSLAVPGPQVPLARQEIQDYRRENSAPRETPRPLAAVGRGWPGVLVYAAVIMAVAVLVQQDLFGLDWLGVGRMDAGRMTDGEWWRTVTALTLHLDAGHLLGNLGFGAFFAYFAARHLGTGLAWAAIVAAGTFGNVLNGLVQAPDHRSIGASTAVFGALGLLTGYTWRRRPSQGVPLRTRVGPLVAGIALLAYTGAGGENTDIGAHLMGFIAGLMLGVWFARRDLQNSAAVELAAGAAACCLVAGSWIWGFAAAG